MARADVNHTVVSMTASIEPLQLSTIVVRDGHRLQVDIWYAAGSYPGGGEDAWLLDPNPDRLRVAAVDGITPTERTAKPVGASGAAFAAAVTVAALRGPGRSLRAALAAAHDQLHDPAVVRSRDQMMAAAVAADITGVVAGDLQGSLVNVCDTEAWGQVGGRWEQLAEPDSVTAETRQRQHGELELWRARPGPFDWEGWFLEEDRRAGRVDAWDAPPLGRFRPEPVPYETFLPDGCTQLVVATDGARLTAERVADLDRWVRELRATERDDDVLWHGDVAVIRVSAG